MVCSKAAWVEEFVSGRMDDRAVLEMEAHIEGCEECFLRVAAEAADLSQPQRLSLVEHSSEASRTGRFLRATSLAVTTLQEQARGDADPMARRVVGPYLITGFLGVGGMSIVFRAQHQTTGREVALKTVKMPLVASYLTLLRQEIEFLRGAQHPGIVNVLDSDLLAADPWYAMELFEGQNFEMLNRQLWISEPEVDPAPEGTPSMRVAAGGQLIEVLRLFARLCEPIGFIHAAGMVHGDIKPSNVFLRGQRQPVLMDFGLVSRAKGGIGRESLDVTGRIRGTLPYIAPETIRGQIPDARADLYALGCMLYESTVGAPPFASGSATKIIDMHLTRAPVTPSRRVAGVPPALDDLLMRLLAKHPRERFGHAGPLGAELNAIADSLSTTPSSIEVTTNISEATMPLFRPPMVGRDDELGTILEHAQATASAKGSRDSGGLYLVSGESGIGKTFFTSEVAQHALLAGIQVVTGECIPLAPTTDVAADAGTPPLQPLRRFFEILRDRCRERGPNEVQRLFGPRLDLLAGYVPALNHLRRSGEAASPPLRLPASAARERILAAVADTLEAWATGRCVLLALDDLQWADDLSLGLLEHLDQDFFSRVPLIIVGTYRSDEAGASIERLASKPWVHNLRLGRLTKDQVSAVVGGMLSMPAPPDSLVSYVDAQAEGVPFFAAEYLRALVADGQLVCRRGSWSTRDTDPTWFGAADGPHLPRTLHDLIRGRLVRLPPDVVELLEAGAIVGRRFSTSLVSRLVRRPVGELTAPLSTTVAIHITESDSFESYTFLHDKIRETLYAGLSPDRRRHLHLRAAEAIEESSPNVPEQYGAIANHFRQGGETLRAIGYLEKAGEHALAMSANADADRFLRDAVELEATLSPRLSPIRQARWQRQRGDALQGLGRMAESAGALKASAVLLGRPFPKTKLAFALKLAKEIVRQFWHRLRPQAIKRLSPADVDANHEVVRVFDRMHQASFYLGNDADLVFSTVTSLNASEVGKQPANLAIAYTNAGIMAAVLPIPKLADHYFRLAEAAIAQTTHPTAKSWLLFMEGVYRSWHGQRARAVSCLDRAIPILRNGGFFRRCDEAERARIGIDLFCGLHVGGLAALAALEGRTSRRRDDQIQIWTKLQFAEAHLLQGGIESALDSIDAIRSLLPTAGRPERIWATGLETYLCYRRGDLARSHELATSAMALIAQGPPVHNHCINAYDRLAETAVELLRLAQSADSKKTCAALAREACDVLARASRIFPIAGPSASLHRGLLQLLETRTSQGKVIETWRLAAQRAKALEQPYREMQLQAAIVKLGNPNCSEASAHRQRRDDLLSSLELEACDGGFQLKSKTPLGSRIQVEINDEGRIEY